MQRAIKIATLVLLLVLAGTSVNSDRSASAFHFASCWATCAHESHGTTGWSGPIRTGENASAVAQQDADAHNKANPGHDASTNCN
jgi:hypothetical protein